MNRQQFFDILNRLRKATRNPINNDLLEAEANTLRLPADKQQT